MTNHSEISKEELLKVVDAKLSNGDLDFIEVMQTLLNNKDTQLHELREVANDIERAASEFFFILHTKHLGSKNVSGLRKKH